MLLIAFSQLENPKEDSQSDNDVEVYYIDTPD